MVKGRKGGRKERRKEGEKKEDRIEVIKVTLGHAQQNTSICHKKGVIISTRTSVLIPPSLSKLACTSFDTYGATKNNE